MTQTQTNGTPVCTKPVKRGFPVHCLECGETECVRVYLDDVTGMFQCNNCDAEYTPADVRERLAGWEAVLAWVETAPVNE